MCKQYPDLNNVLALTKEFFHLCNTYYTAPHPGPKLNQQWWLHLLQQFPNNKINKKLQLGIKQGVRLGINRKDLPLLDEPTNIISSVKELEELLKKLISDIQVRNKQPVMEKPKYISCIFMKDEIKKYRLITHASKSKHGKGSLNANIRDDHKNVVLWNLKTLCKWLYLHGAKQGLYVTTYDLKDYFHHFHLHPHDVPYCGYQVFGNYLVALFSPYGVASVPQIACTHSEISTVKFHKQAPLHSQDTQKYYVDDCTLIHTDYWELHKNGLQCLKIVNDAGLTEQCKKRTWCERITKIYGWIFNTNNMTIRLPFDKLEKIKKILNIFLFKVDYCTTKFLFKVCGLLMHYSQINKIIKIICIKVVKLIYENINTNLSIKRQLNKIILIPTFIKNHFNIFYHFITKTTTFSIESIINEYKPQLLIATDATLISYGIYCNGTYVSSFLPFNMIGQPIHLCECWAVLQAIYLFECKNMNVVVYTDNEPTSKVMQNYWCKDLQWEPYLSNRAKFMIKNNCIIDVIYVKGKCNIFADYLSRGKLKSFKDACKKYKKPCVTRLYPKPLFKLNYN